ncbi:LacI family DNA-binding transcriptional regulator [Paenibacillus sp. MBLB4367]|uniref:LacI family DNA-binding transcriptional regulator n=1 Tax=Paenibacillus sp. MBLB4367 TaxID=3384767 RepID=UPI0039080240
MPTLKDIALRVGVSISTVSRAISNDTARPVNDETKRKIREAADEIGYKWEESPAQPAKQEAKTSKRIGCIIPQSFMDNHPYFSSVLSGFRKKMIDMDQQPFFIRTYEEINDVKRLRKWLAETGVQGVLVLGWYEKSLFELLQAEGVFLLGVSMNDESIAISTVDCDRLLASRAAVRHLIAQGHSKIGYIGGPAFSYKLEDEDRYLGYKFAMLEFGLKLNPDWMLNANWNVDRSYSLMTDMLNHLPADERPTAMFCASDMLAIPAMRAALEKKCRIPEDMAFVGMDNIEVAQYTSPPLTSVQVPKNEIGEVAAKVLVDYLEGAYSYPSKILLPCDMIVRESSVYDRTGMAL